MMMYKCLSSCCRERGDSPNLSENPNALVVPQNHGPLEVEIPAPKSTWIAGWLSMLSYG